MINVLSLLLICFLNISLCLDTAVSGEGKAINFNEPAVKEFTDNIDKIKANRLTIKILPVDGEAIYITFPEGGNMLIGSGFPQDSREFIGLLKDEMFREKKMKKSSVMGLFGWKPRIDLLVLVSTKPEQAGGVEKLLENFNVRKVISNIDLIKVLNDTRVEPGVRRLAGILLSTGLDNIKLKDGDTVNPVASLVNLTAIDTQDVLSLRLSYLGFSMLILSDGSEAAQARIMKRTGSNIKSKVLLSGEMTKLKDSFKTKVSPKITRTYKNKVTFVTDGNLIYIPAQSKVKRGVE